MNPPPERPDRAPALFARGAWALTLALALGFVGRYGSDVPVWDDFDVLGPAIGTRPISAAWLWSQHNEHRVPLPRLVLLGLDRAFGHDARTGMVVSVLTLATAAALLIAAARRARGRPAFADAVFPLILLGFGHHANLLWSWQVQFTLSTSLFLAIVAGIASQRGAVLGVRPAAVVGLATALLPLCGANGLAFVPALFAWLALEASYRWSRGELREALLILFAALPSFLLLPLYQHGYQRAEHHPLAAGAGAVVRALLQFASLAWGPVGGDSWAAFGAATLTLGALGAALVLVAIARRAPDAVRLRGLFFAFGAFGCLAAGLAWGRAGSGEQAGLESRYVTLASPALCLVYLATLAWPRATVRDLVSMTLLAALLVLAWPNAEAGIAAASERAGHFAALERDLASGASASWIARQHAPFLHPSQDVLLEWLPELRRAGVARFGRLRDEPPSREVPLPVEPSSLRLARREGPGFVITGVDPEIAFRTPGPMFVRGIRLRYDHENADGTPARFRLGWRRPGQADFPADQSYSNWSMPTGAGRVTTVWVHDDVEEFRIQPDNRPCSFRIESITLLVPPAGSAGPIDSHHSSPATTSE